ncbi:cyclin N-terminal domain-containing protein 1 isoform X2 [Temnothorax nylanderi]|uniref:cyclin N-terminal domain-containing protein 1 isoform X2 n=1 Tax=Temnothorax nylanderi TaxID=102681 RepID=UPI003A852ACA
MCVNIFFCEIWFNQSIYIYIYIYCVQEDVKEKYKYRINNISYVTDATRRTAERGEPCSKIIKDKKLLESLQVQFSIAFSLNLLLEPLIHDWVEHLQQTMKKQEQEQIANATDFDMPFVASTVKAAFNIAEYLELEPNVKYMAIQLYDRFMCKHFWEIYKTEIANNLSEASWFKVCDENSNQTKLTLMSCFQLACKMDSHSSALGISQILNILHLIDKESEYTPMMISSSEIKVIKTVEFKMPLYTPLHCIEILLAATGLGETPNMVNVSTDLLDLAYLKHDRLYSQFHLYYTHKDVLNAEHVTRKLISLKSNILFLSAAIVYCATFFLCLDTNASEEQVVVTKLAELSNTTDTDIFNMANMLLLIATQD